MALFNVIMDNAIRKWLAIKVEDQRVAHDSLGEAVGRCLFFFKADDHPTHVANRGYTTGVGVVCTGTHTYRDHVHLGYNTTGNPLEGGRDAHR